MGEIKGLPLSIFHATNAYKKIDKELTVRNGDHNSTMAPDRAPTRILKEPHEVRPRILELGLSVSGIVRIARVARNAAANGMTPFHARNAPGTYAYHYGVFATRDEYVPTGDWEIQCIKGIECIFNRARNIRVAFANVDICCNDFCAPKPRSEKGDGAKRICQTNLFGNLPHFAKPSAHSGTPMHYIMVDDEGRCELSQPLIEGKTFSSYVERIYLSTTGNDDPDGLDLDNGGDTDPLTDFDPIVLRK